jgi:hypothetical protein
MGNMMISDEQHDAIRWLQLGNMMASNWQHDGFG